MNTVFYDAGRNTLYVSGIATPFPAGSLQAKQLGSMLAVANPMDGTLLCAWADFGAWTIQGSSTFASADEAFSALQAACTTKRPVGETFGVSGVAGADLIKGQPVTVSRASGRLLPARADTYTRAFVAGLASADTAQGFTNQPAHGAVTLPDWTGLTGFAALAVGQMYFLGAAGGLTTAPRLDTACVARVGLATAPQTLVVEPSAPIIL